MAKILDILRSEYSSEYSDFYSLKKYSKPKIFPKVVTTKPISAFTNVEKEIIMQKYKRWYVYYNYLNSEGKMERQPAIYFNLNRKFQDFDERLKHFRLLRNRVEKLLKNGYSPIEVEEPESIYAIESALNYALSLKQIELKEAAYNDYKNKKNDFIKFLKRNNLHRKSANDITKKHINNYLNQILKKTSPRNRNNHRSVLSSLFTKLVVEDFLDYNFIKDGIPVLKSKSKKNTAFTQDEVKLILKTSKEKDIWLYYYLCHIYYALFRNVEIVRIKIRDVNLKENIIKAETKTGDFYKQIPQVLIDEFYCKINLEKYKKNYFLFTKDDTPNQWLSPKGTETKEINRRGYWGKRFTRVIREPMGFSDEYTAYSLRHSAIGKMFIEQIGFYKKQGVVNFEEKALDFIRTITAHKSNEIVRNYLREIGYYKIDDWSELLK